MLEKILNINPQDKYKSGLKVPSGNNFIVNKYDQDRQNSRDSALFSPLAKLMSQINWRILNIEYPSNDEILMNFMVNDLEFITVINFNEMYSKPYQEFSIYRTRNLLNKRKHYEAKLKVEKYEVSILQTPDPIETENLSILIDRIAKLNFMNNQKIFDLNILNKLINDIKLDINKELNYILKVIYTFISTRNKSKVKNNFLLKTKKNIPIIMQEVAIIYAE